MKNLNLVLTIAAGILAAASVICLVIANMEKILSCLSTSSSVLKEKTASLCCCPCRANSADSYEDEFEDWDL